jgi:hypothetical protein
MVFLPQPSTETDRQTILLGRSAETTVSRIPASAVCSSTGRQGRRPNGVSAPSKSLNMNGQKASTYPKILSILPIHVSFPSWQVEHG